MTGEPRLLNEGDRLTVALHTPGSPTAVCVQRDASGRRVIVRVIVPAAVLRVVKATDDPDADDGDHTGGGPVGAKPLTGRESEVA